MRSGPCSRLRRHRKSESQRGRKRSRWSQRESNPRLKDLRGRLACDGPSNPHAAITPWPPNYLTNTSRFVIFAPIGRVVVWFVFGGDTGNRTRNLVIPVPRFTVATMPPRQNPSPGHAPKQKPGLTVLAGHLLREYRWAPTAPERPYANFPTSPHTVERLKNRIALKSMAFGP